jgi:hypothetical protein
MKKGGLKKKKGDSEWSWFAEVLFFGCCSSTLLADESRVLHEVLVGLEVSAFLRHVTKVL